MHNAQQARKVATKIREVAENVKKSIVEQKQAIVETTFQEKVASNIKFYDSKIKQEIDSGNFYVQLSYPETEEMFYALKKHYEDLGYRFTSFKTDEGYCIGDVWHVQIDW